MTRERLSLYDTTLRDGAQTHGVDFSVEDKWLIAQQLDALGHRLYRGRLSRREPDRHAAVRRGARAWACAAHRVRHDQAARPLARQRSGLPGAARRQDARPSAWSARPGTSMSMSRSASRTTRTSRASKTRSRPSSPAAARRCSTASISSTATRPIPTTRSRCAKTAYEAGARWVVLCDTNGGTLPEEIERIVDGGGEGDPRRPSRHPCA